MNYFVVGDDGNKYGPADVATLNQWAQQGRLNATSVLEDAQTGARYSASQVPGIQIAGAGFQSATQSGYQQPPNYQQPPYGQNPYQQYPRNGMGMYGDDGAQDIQKAWIFGGIGIICCPVVFSSLGIYFALQGQRKGHPSGQAALYFCIATLIIGCALGVFLNVAMR
jgi:hypothetical protein